MAKKQLVMKEAGTVKDNLMGNGNYLSKNGITTVPAKFPEAGALYGKNTVFRKVVEALHENRGKPYKEVADACNAVTAEHTPGCWMWKQLSQSGAAFGMFSIDENGIFQYNKGKDVSDIPCWKRGKSIVCINPNSLGGEKPKKTKKNKKTKDEPQTETKPEKTKKGKKGKKGKKNKKAIKEQ